jgi:hypothetical protein
MHASPMEPLTCATVGPSSLDIATGRCEICETQVDLEVHHIRKLADLNKPGRRGKPAWMHLMAKRRRKTLVVCRRCHKDVHAGRATAPAKDQWRAV